METSSGHLCAICNGDTDIDGLRYATLDGNRSDYFCKKCVQKDETAVRERVCSHCNSVLSERVGWKVVKKAVDVVPPTIITKGRGIPDVWYGYGSGVHTEENIADPKTGEPIPFWDKASKRDAMRRAGVREAGDRVHGYRNEDMTPAKRKKYFT